MRDRVIRSASQIMNDEFENLWSANKASDGKRRQALRSGATAKQAEWTGTQREESNNFKFDRQKARAMWGEKFIWLTVRLLLLLAICEFYGVR